MQDVTLHIARQVPLAYVAVHFSPSGMETYMEIQWMPLLAVVWIGYVIVLGAVIVLQKRDPAATLSWLFGLAAFPVIGLFVYRLLGPQRIERHRIRRSRYTGRALQPSQPDTPEVEKLARMVRRSTGMPMSDASSVSLLVDGAAKYASLLQAVRDAEHEIHLEYYIYSPDHIGTALRDALVERAQAGVAVRLLVDAVGSLSSRRFFGVLQDAGGEVAWFHPTRIDMRRPWVNLRTHRKIAVIDKRIGYTGGINITDNEDDSRRDDAYRDLHLRVEGRVVRELQQCFVEDWAYATGDDTFLDAMVAAQPPPPPAGTIPAQVVTAGPDNHWEPIHRLKVNAIHSARQRVWLMTPYFVPGEAAIMALTSAALSGVDVRVMVPKNSDSRLVTLAARSYFDTLHAAGVTIHEYGPRMLHTKALLVDDTISIIGTANFDNRSFRLNFEVALLFDDEGIATQLAELYLHEMQNAEEVSCERARPLFATRLPEGLARLMAPLL